MLVGDESLMTTGVPGTNPVVTRELKLALMVWLTEVTVLVSASRIFFAKSSGTEERVRARLNSSTAAETGKVMQSHVALGRSWSSPVHVHDLPKSCRSSLGKVRLLRDQYHLWMASFSLEWLRSAIVFFASSSSRVRSASWRCASMRARVARMKLSSAFVMRSLASAKAESLS